MFVQFEWNWEGLLDTLWATNCLHILKISFSKLNWSITALWTYCAWSLFRAKSLATRSYLILLYCGKLALINTSSTTLALSSLMNIAFIFNRSVYALLCHKYSFFFWFDHLWFLFNWILFWLLEVICALIFWWPRMTFTWNSASFGLLPSSFVEKGICFLYRKGIWLERWIWFKCKSMTPHSKSVGSISSWLYIGCVRITSCLWSFFDLFTMEGVFLDNWFWGAENFLWFVTLLRRKHSINFNRVLNSRWTGN